MDRDKVLYLVIGFLAGFIGGYVGHEFMAARQSPPAWPAAVGIGAPAGSTAGSAQPSSGAAPPAAAAGGQAAMQQVQQLAAYVRDNPEDANAVRQLANLNYDISNWQRAADLYSQYLGLVPSDFDVMTDLGATYRYLRKPQQALEQFRKVRELAPEHWQARYNEILVLAFDLNDLPAANAALSELQSLQPENPEVARLAAELEKRSGGARE